MSVQKKFTLVVSITLICLALLIALLTATLQTQDINLQIEKTVTDKTKQINSTLSLTDQLVLERVKSSMHLLKQRGAALGESAQVGSVIVGGTEAPNIYLGNSPQGNRFALVDGLTDIMGGTATIFSRKGEDYIRISTNVIKNGDRAIGTKLSPTGKAIQKIREKNAYYGQVDILGSPYLTAYEPMINGQDQTIGIWYVGYSADLNELRESIGTFKILETGFVALADSKGDIRIHSDHVSHDFISQVLDGSQTDWATNEALFEPWGYKIITAYPKSEVRTLIRQAVFSTLLKVVFGSLLLIVVILYLVDRLVGKPMQAYIKSISDIAHGDGDLRVKFDSSSGCEFGTMGKGFNQLLEKIRQTIQDIADMMPLLSDISIKIAHSSEQAHLSSAHLSDEAATVSASVYQMSTAAQSVEHNARDSEQLAQEVEKNTREGFETLQESIAATTKQKEELDESMVAINELARDSENIGGVIDVISTIAEQTNLLALNAAIEAARAGDQGRGFAVVADEVRSLASRTQRSTVDIKEMIEKLQAGSSRACDLIERNKKQASISANCTTQAGSALQKVLDQMSEISKLNESNASASGEQSSVSNDLAVRMESIRLSSDNSKEISLQLEHLSHDLTDMSDKLQNTIKAYKF